MSLVIAAMSYRSRIDLQSRAISAVLPEPTGPPTPMRSGPWDLDMCDAFSFVVPAWCTVRTGAGTHTAGSIDKAQPLTPFGRTRAGGYGSLRSQGRRKRVQPHDRNNLVYCVSWRRLARSGRKVALPRSSIEACSARLAVETTTGSRAARMRWL